jgi:hypothetical protein
VAGFTTRAVRKIQISGGSTLPIAVIMPLPRE